MNEQPTFNGHRVEGCTGSWISIATLARPTEAICSECRARVHSTEALEAPAVLPAPEQPVGLTNLPARALWLLAGIAAALAIPAVIAIVWAVRRG
jgi:hypothetical protein